MQKDPTIYMSQYMRTILDNQFSTRKEFRQFISNKTAIKNILIKDLKINLNEYDSIKRLNLYRILRNAIVNYPQLSKAGISVEHTKFINFLSVPLRKAEEMETSSVTTNNINIELSDDESLPPITETEEQVTTVNNKDDIITIDDDHSYSNMLSSLNLSKINDSNEVIISGSVNNIYNLLIKHENDSFKAYKKDNNLTAESQALKIFTRELLFWPDLITQIKLPHITYTRLTKMNNIRSFQIKPKTEDNNIQLNIVKNDINNVKRLKNFQPLKELTSHLIIKNYIELFIRILDSFELDSKNESKILVKKFLSTMLTDLSKLECTYIDKTYLFYLNNYKLHRKFDITHEESKSNVYLLEEINPEIHFTINSTDLTDNFQADNLRNYFDDILKNKKSEEIKNMLLTSISFKCNLCQTIFNDTELLINHICIHFNSMNWKCNNCKETFEQKHIFKQHFIHLCPPKVNND